MRFWLERGVDGFRFDTVNYYFHDRKFRSNPADQRDKEVAEGNPYGMQVHLYDKNQPENLDWLARIRTLLDEYEATSVGEVGDGHFAIRLMGNTRPRAAASVLQFRTVRLGIYPDLFRDRVEGFFSGAPKGWPMWALSNHDVPRHVTRWTKPGADGEALAKQAASLLLALEGSICLWEGEELGQTDTELALEELTDPQGIAFWPEPVGRGQHPHSDGLGRLTQWRVHYGDALAAGQTRTGRPPCRGAGRQAGVCAGTLPRDAGLPACGTCIAAGRTRFLDLPEPVLGFTRGKGEGAVLCVFNLSADVQTVKLGNAGDIIGPSLGGAHDRGTLTLAPNAAVLCELGIRPDQRQDWQYCPSYKAIQCTPAAGIVAPAQSTGTAL